MLAFVLGLRFITVGRIDLVEQRYKRCQFGYWTLVNATRITESNFNVEEMAYRLIVERREKLASKEK